MYKMSAEERRARRGRIIRKILQYFFLMVFVMVIMSPLYYIFLSAFQPREDMFTIPLNYWPRHPTLEHFIRVFNTIPYARYILNTTILSLGCSVAVLIVAIPAAYAFARIDFPGSNLFLMGLLASGMLPGVATIIPLFQMFQRLGLVNNLLGLAILYISGNLAFTIWVSVSFLRQVPRELDEAARIDGASTLQLISKVIIPIIRPGIATLFIINFIIYWNEFFLPLIFARDTSVKTVTLGISEAAYIGQYQQAWENISAMGTMVVAPIFLLALFFQKQIIEGIMAGALK
ncbi:MAG: carbohydrate ABC transporter permease [bacterium]